jgi:hypothetical protein
MDFQDLRQQRISGLAAALVAASRLLKTNNRTKPQAAAVADDDYERIETVPRKDRGNLDRSLVNNIVALEMIRMQQEAS